MMTVSPTPVPTLAPSRALSWVLYRYDGRGYMTFRGRLIATATCTTTTQEAHLRAILDRLNASATNCSEVKRA